MLGQEEKTQGKIFYKGGFVYQGAIKQWKRHGYGTLELQDKFKYEG